MPLKRSHFENLKMAIGLAFLLSIVAAPAVSQTAFDPTSDLKLLQDRSQSLSHGREVLENLIEMVRGNSGPDADMQNRALVLGNFAMRASVSGLPIDIRRLALLPLASRRSSYIATLLESDLDGDWVISKEELTYATANGANGDAARLFVTGDKNEDGVLSIDEMKVITSESAAAAERENQTRLHMLQIFDLNNDGMFSTEELDRTMAALLNG